MKNIDKGIRFTNYIIDFLVISITSTSITLLLGLYNTQNIIFYLFMFLYYLIFESINGQTLGKIVTQTKVVSKNGSRPSIGKIILRSFMRLIPIDALSYLFGYELGLHDTLSYTKLTKMKND